MESEVQKRRTYEILAKYIGEQSQIKVELNDDGRVCADPKTGEIQIPRNIKADNVYPAVAWIIHEASHIKHTKHIDAEKIINDMVDFHILNACEDVRIDREAFNILPNVNGIYREMLKILTLKDRAKDPKIPVEVKVLSDCIMKLERFDHASSHDPVIEGFINDTNMLMEMERLIQILWQLEWTKGTDGQAIKDAKAQVKVIRDLLSNIKKQNQKKQKQSGQGQGKPGNDKDTPCDVGQGGQDKQGAGQSGGKGDLDLSRLEDTSVSGGVCKLVFGNLDKKAHNPQVIGSAALHELTETAFKELLNQKETQKIEHGQVLDTENLTAFLTGDIDDLFTEEITVRKKKSKLVMVLDSSGSMMSPLMDNNMRHQTVCSTAKAIARILDEVHMLEGINVDYAVRRFDSGYYQLSKENWEKEYLSKIGGGTNIVTAFEGAQKELLTDYTIEGRKLIVFITDGEVSNDQIESIRKSIMSHASDVRAMVLGVGAEVNGAFVRNVSGHNIMTKDLADVVLMEAIVEMLE